LFSAVEQALLRGAPADRYQVVVRERLLDIVEGPWLTAWIALCSEAWAVIRITGVSGSCSRTAARISVPETPGHLDVGEHDVGRVPLQGLEPRFSRPERVVTSNLPLSRDPEHVQIPISSSTTRIVGCWLMPLFLFAAARRGSRP